ncbi:MAG: response regulator transcription factor [Clostridia bacterium]|nr:response regulator transcription factor [Clostridia bacterium]
MRILVAEDEIPLAKAIVKIFEKSNYSADAVYNGEDALNYLQVGDYDVAVLDIMMPKIDGLEVLRRLRGAKNNLPVIILTARSEIEDKVQGLDAGANYYLTKPFDSRELLAALRAITRGKETTDSRISYGNVTLDRATYQLMTPSGEFRLANKEFQMMEMLMINPRQLISTEKFMEKIWGYDSESEISVVWVYVSYLRKKLSKLSADVEIRSMRNAGYSLEEKQ